MSKNLNARRLNMPVFAQAGTPLVEHTPLQDMQRLAAEVHGLTPDLAVDWRATGELRARTGVEDDVWLHLHATTSLPLTCQRCMAAVATPLEVDQWYRFVADEDIAMAEDDESEEDLLVMESLFDVLAVLEDELLMALPLVPMHETCPVSPVFSAGEADLAPQDGEAEEKPNPFAALAKLKKSH